MRFFVVVVVVVVVDDDVVNFADSAMCDTVYPDSESPSCFLVGVVFVVVV